MAAAAAVVTIVVLLLFLQGLDPVADDPLAVLSDDAFWVELHALYVRVLLVHDSHYGAILSPGCHLQVCGAGVLGNEQAVIPGCQERAGEDTHTQHTHTTTHTATQRQRHQQRC